MKASTRKLMDMSTPFVVFDFAGVQIRQYWTQNKGLYGYQVVTVVLDGDEVPDHRTGGCGYDKPSAGLEWAFEQIGSRPEGMLMNGNIPRQYYVGGNYDAVPTK